MTDQLLEIANGNVDEKAAHAALDAMKAAREQGVNDFFQFRKAIEAYAQAVTGVNRVSDWQVKCPHCDHVAQGFKHPRSADENPHILLRKHVEAAHPDQTFACPRRDEVGGAAVFKILEGRDFWSTDRGHRHCSYCGSAHPDDVMQGIEDGTVEVGPTDKSYKAYLEGGVFGDREKFYFQHLSEAQQVRFVELLNAKKMRVGYPGHFYRLPFFIQRGQPAPA